MKIKKMAFPQKLGDVTQYQWIESGLSRMEYFALHLMCSSVTANDHSNPSWMTDKMAENHAKNAILLAKHLDKVLNEAENNNENN